MIALLISILFTANASEPLPTHPKFSGVKKSYQINGETISESIVIETKNFDFKNFSFKNFMKLTETIGHVFPPGTLVLHTKKAGNEIIYDTKYTVGDYGLRIIPDFYLNIKAVDHLIIAGDSNVFSEGTSDQESLSAWLSRDLKNFHLYNFGHRGGGPHNTLSLMENYPFEKMIKESRGVFLYDFFTPHLFERVIGSKNYTAWDHGSGPYYDLNDEGKLIRRGKFSDRTFINPIYEFISRHKWLNDLLPNLPQLNERHIEITVQILLKMKAEYLKKFPEGRFIVLVNNSYSQVTDKTTKFFLEKLAQNAVQIMQIDYQTLLQKELIFKDLHITGKGQKIQAQLIAQKLLKILFPHHPIGNKNK